MGIARIIEFGRHRKGAAPDTREIVAAHWREIGGARDVPFRHAVDPGALGAALGEVLVLERIAPRQARIRLGGQAVSALLGLDLRGLPLGALFDIGSHARLGELTETLFETPARVEMAVTGPRGAFRPRASGSVLILPLRDHAGRITRAIAHVALPETGRTSPTRLSITGARVLPVAARREVALPEDPMVFETADRARAATRRRAALRLVAAD